MNKLIILLIAAVGLCTGVARSQKIGDGETITTTVINVGIKGPDGIYKYGEDKAATVKIFMGTSTLRLHADKDMAIQVQNRARHYGEPNLQQSGYYWFWDAVDSKGRKCQLRIDVYERGETDIIIIYDDISILYGLITSPHGSNLSSFSEEGGNK
jgi:hypothetical protein